MARFGLLLQNYGVWQSTQILRDADYFIQMINSSQQLNPVYGYLFWLNGQDFYRQPGLEFTFNGPLVPAAPMDMFAAMGKNDQSLYIAPSQELVVVRMGDAADNAVLALSGFDNELWQYLNRIIHPAASVHQKAVASPLRIFPNPFTENLFVELQLEELPRSPIHIKIFNMLGTYICTLPLQPVLTPQQLVWDGKDAFGNPLPASAYILTFSPLNITRVIFKLN